MNYRDREDRFYALFKLFIYFSLTWSRFFMSALLSNLRFVLISLLGELFSDRYKTNGKVPDTCIPVIQCSKKENKLVVNNECFRDIVFFRHFRFGFLICSNP